MYKKGGKYMAVKLRLQRFGAKKRPYYRIVAADSKAPRDGRFIEIIGTYHPIEKDNILKIDEEKALNWLNNGAQPTDTVRSLLSRMGIMEKFAKRNKR
jgi:small subunit ribosomal protein S16